MHFYQLAANQGNEFAQFKLSVRNREAQNQGPLHLVSAWSTKNHFTLGQIKTNKKSNEITAIKELLSLLDIKDCTISIDAIGCV